MNSTSRHETLSVVSKCVASLIQQLTPDPEAVCFRALRDLGALASVAKTFSAVDVPSHFRAGIQEVILQLDAFRTGFARTADQEGGADLLKASCFKPQMKDVSLEDFVKHADGIIRKAIACATNGAAGSALVALHTLAADIAKAESFADGASETITVTVENDPMKIVETEASGTLMPAGTSSATTADSNYVTNPGDVTATAPSTAPNPATASAAVVSSNTPAGDSNFVAKGDDAVAKGVAAICETVAKCEPLAKAQEVGWALDLNTPEFMRGDRSPIRW
jgi:hypothetical protein